MDYRDNRQRWAESHQVVHFYAGQWCTFTPALTAKADLVLVDLDHPLMQPLWDPLRSLIYSAAERAVRDVYVDGRQVVRDQRMLSFDMEDAGKRLQASQARIAEAVMGRDEAGRTAEQLSPLALAQVRGLAPD